MPRTMQHSMVRNSATNAMPPETETMARSRVLARPVVVIQPATIPAMAQAAATVNMSYSHYSRQFKRIMGRSFREYINAVRISAAENLLLTTDMSVTDIALASGFATSSHFIESFKKHKKITPAKYRQLWGRKK